jgi:hypothetical protein
LGADMTKVVPASAENASAVEAAPPRAKADAPPVPEEPATTADGQQGIAARPEARKRGRSKKAEAKPGKRQKSLFDCISYINIKFNSLT